MANSNINPRNKETIPKLVGVICSSDKVYKQWQAMYPHLKGVKITQYADALGYEFDQLITLFPFPKNLTFEEHELILAKVRIINER